MQLHHFIIIKMNSLIIGLTFLLPAHGLPSVPVLKCCPHGSVLDETSGGYRCVSQVAVDVFVVINGLNVTAPGHKNSVQQIKLEKKGVARPACQQQELHVIQTEGSSENWITTTGDLVTRKYEAEFDHGEFCLDRSRGGDRTSIVALMCDPCKTKACISLCCPHGYAKQPDPLAPPGSPLVCLPHPESQGWNPEFWDSTTQQLVAKERHTDYVIVGAVGQQGFSCPKFDGKRVEISPAHLHYEVTQLDDSGRLVGTLYNETNVFKQNQFCLAYAKFPDYDYDYEDGSGEYEHENATEGDVIVNIELTTVEPEYEVGGGSSLATLFLVCENPKAASATDNFVTAFYPSALLISAFFILVTIVVYILLSELHGNLFGKITIGFLLNLFISYIVFAYGFIKDDLRVEVERETIGCYLLGYMKMYTFLAFFFWLSAMAFNIVRKFSNIMRISGFDASKDKRNLIIIILYSQGSPLLLCIFTYLMDYTKPEGGVQPNSNLEPDPYIRPNMAVYNCFLGSEPSLEESYFSSPVFLYFHLVIIIIQLFNLVCFLVTATYLIRHWRTAKNLKKNNDEDHLTNFFILLKLFILMGIPWCAELISGAIEYTSYNPEANVGVIVIDLINLFIGVLIFFVLVIKRSVWDSLRKRALGRDSSGTASRKNTTMSTSSVVSASYEAESRM